MNRDALYLDQGSAIVRFEQHLAFPPLLPVGHLITLISPVQKFLPQKIFEKSTLSCSCALLIYS